MRLINTTSLLLEEFWGSSAPPYAILSHRWEMEEVSYREWYKATKKGHLPLDSPLRPKAGFCKIARFCGVAFERGHQYVWVDTCCIDKTSSAELQEAINSMFRWYKQAQACYAYLSDWPAEPNHTATGRNQMPCSEWFTRGWTLQELVAPAEVVFLDCNWNQCGTRSSLARDISAITGISKRCLSYSPDANPGSVNWWVTVWERMSWASGRKTTRIEDRAYSLLGLFGIHMPMLYGEAEQSFRRLQEEIIKVEEDCSILAWNALPHDVGFAACGLASSPDHFGLHNVFEQTCMSGQFEMSPLTMIQRGLQAPLMVRRDINDPSIGYVMIHQEHQRELCLVIPILFSKGDLYSFVVENACVRISDPVSVPKEFMAHAERKHICFLREPLGLQPDILWELRLQHSTWCKFEVTFSYPPQLQVGRQSFPMLLGKLSTRPHQAGALVIGIRNRVNGNRYLVIAQYQTLDGRILGLVVRTAWCQFIITLPKAEALVHSPSLMGSLEFSELVDENGVRIHHTDILELRANARFWVNGSDDGIT